VFNAYNRVIKEFNRDLTLFNTLRPIIPNEKAYKTLCLDLEDAKNPEATQPYEVRLKAFKALIMDFSGHGVHFLSPWQVKTMREYFEKEIRVVYEKDRFLA
jgi:hypothetical protein